MAGYRIRILKYGSEECARSGHCPIFIRVSGIGPPSIEQNRKAIDRNVCYANEHKK